MDDMDPGAVLGPCRAHRLTFHDGSQRQVYCTELETPYPDGKLIVSRTDPRGLITQCNQAFVDISGYSQAELIGQPHCILRHPDMPRAAYADLWATVVAGGKWHGYVKNLRRDGGFYWVHAVVVANVRQGVVVGYTSVRRKPSRSKVEAARARYAELAAQEAR